MTTNVVDALKRCQEDVNPAIVLKYENDTIKSRTIPEHEICNLWKIAYLEQLMHLVQQQVNLKLAERKIDSMMVDCLHQMAKITYIEAFKSFIIRTPRILLTSNVS